MIMKSIDDLVCEANKPVYISDRVTQIPVQEAYRGSERRAVLFRYDPAAMLTGFMEQLHHTMNIMILADCFDQLFSGNLSTD